MFEKETFEIKGADDLPIIGDITYSNSYPDYLVIFVHGFKGFKDWGTHNLTASYFADKSIFFLKFNFSHSGVKPDDLSDIKDLELFSKNTPSKELYDLDKVIDFAAKKFPHLQIVLLGHSRGGAISILQAAKDNRVKKLLTWAAIGNFRDLWNDEDEPEWRKAGIHYILNGRTKELMPLDISLLDDVLNHKKEFDLNNAAKIIRKPWLIVQGENDAAVKVKVAEKFHQDQPQTSKLMVVEGANHVFGASHPYKKEVLPKDLEKVVLACADFVKAAY
ncbi:alpha/beta hydrolase [Pedobacter sp. SD-b]|uniref:Alpha/beta hydrolase n=1 Tax=Pedobacter segetis TaxID=2793069 RepID=A0ABS1BIG2_9SPHI|nr:alpha/beta hydrolase [Pedobacter segetis]MBK0382151.1 alpha/beta hydrolase [Pedobacter segetis]